MAGPGWMASARSPGNSEIPTPVRDLIKDAQTGSGGDFGDIAGFWVRDQLETATLVMQGIVSMS